MDICFKALHGEKTGRMVEDVTAARPKLARSASSALASTPFPYGDITGLTTWFLFSMRPRLAATREEIDVAA